MPIKLTSKDTQNIPSEPQYIYIMKENIGYFRAARDGGTTITCSTGILNVVETCEEVAQKIQEI